MIIFFAHLNYIIEQIAATTMNIVLAYFVFW